MSILFSSMKLSFENDLSIFLFSEVPVKFFIFFLDLLYKIWYFKYKFGECELRCSAGNVSEW